MEPSMDHQQSCASWEWGEHPIEPAGFHLLKREKNALFPGCLNIQCQQWAEKTAAVRTVAARGGRPRAGRLQKLVGSSRGVLLGTREDTVSELDQPAGEMP